MNILSLPIELTTHIYQNLDIRTQAALEWTDKNPSFFIPSLEHKCMKRIVRDRLFDPNWEKETNPDIKQKIANYRSRLEKLIREVILSEDKSDTPDVEIKALSTQIKFLREEFSTDVLEEKKMWDLFGGRDKFLDLPVIKLPKRLRTFYNQNQLYITSWDMGNNAIMRGVDHEGCEFFLLRARLDSTTYRFASDHLRIQLIRFDNHKKQWEPLAVSNQVLFVKNSDELNSAIERRYLRELVQQGRYPYTPFDLPVELASITIELVYSLSSC